MLPCQSFASPVHPPRSLISVGLSTAFSNWLQQLQEFSFISCVADHSVLTELWKNSLPCVLVGDQDFILRYPPKLLRRFNKLRGHSWLLAVHASGSCRSSELLHMGCSGVISGDIGPSEFRRTLDAVIRGQLWYSQTVLSDAIRRFISPFGMNHLTPREVEVLDMLAKGYRNNEIAQALSITRETVRWHQRSLYTKIGTSDRKQAAILYQDELRAGVAS